MSSHLCHYCLGIMDPQDGHHECPNCLGMAHLMDDIENPCVAAVELPVEERVKRARWVEQPVRAGAVQPLPAQLNERWHTSRKGPRKRRHEHTPVRRRDSGKKQAPKSSQNPAGQQDDTQLQILAAIRGLSERLGRVEAQYPATTAKASGHGHSKESSPDRLPSCQEENVVHPDILSLYAQNSLFESDEQSEGAAGRKCGKHSGAQCSNWGSCSSGWNLGRHHSVTASVTVPVAGDYLHIIRKTWKIPSCAPQFNAGCWRLAKIQYAPETGIGDMPPVEWEMAALTSLGPERVTANLRCPLKESLYSALSEGLWLPRINLGAPSLPTNHHPGLVRSHGCMAGDRLQDSQPLVTPTAFTASTRVPSPFFS